MVLRGVEENDSRGWDAECAGLSRFQKIHTFGPSRHTPPSLELGSASVAAGVRRRKPDETIEPIRRKRGRSHRNRKRAEFGDTPLPSFIERPLLLPLRQPQPPPPTGATRRRLANGPFAAKKAGTVRFAPRPPPQWRLALGTFLLFHLKPACGGSPTCGEQLALSRPGNGRVGPVDIPTGRYSHCKGCVKSEPKSLRKYHSKD